MPYDICEDDSNDNFVFSGNMPYDICEDDSCLDYIESEMARRGVTQELIDETRAATETKMLEDLQIIASTGGDLEMVDHQGATPVSC